MLSDWIQSSVIETPVDLSEVTTLINTMEVRTDISEEEMDCVEEIMQEVIDSAGEVHELLALMRQADILDKDSATMVHAVLNTKTESYGVSIAMETLFNIEDEVYEVSMEGIEFSWKEVWRLVKAATQFIVDQFRAFFGRRLTLVGKQYQDLRQLTRILPKVQLANAAELLTIKGDFNGAASWMMHPDNKDPVSCMHVTASITAATASTLSPTGYRAAIEAIVQTLASGKSMEPKELKDIVLLQRKELYRELQGYLECQEALIDTNVLVRHKGKVLPGYQYFLIEQKKDSMQAPSVALTLHNAKSKPEGFTMTPISTSYATELSRVGEVALDVVLQLRQVYEANRQFKKRVDGAVKALKERTTDTPEEKDLVELYRALPSYAKCYDQPLKAKSEVLFRWTKALLKVIAQSRPHWKVTI